MLRQTDNDFCFCGDTVAFIFDYVCFAHIVAELKVRSYICFYTFDVNEMTKLYACA